MDNKKIIKWLLWVIFLVLALGMISVVAFCTGAVKISIETIISSIFKDGSPTSSTILLSIRLPRIILAIAVGGGLALVGVLLQGVFRNPLVEPYTLGISGGGCLGVCLGIVTSLGGKFGIFSLPLLGFFGSMAVVWVLYVLSMRKNVLRMKGVLLSGVMISYITSSLIMLIMAMARVTDLHGIVFWTMGSLEESNPLLMKLVMLISLAGLIISYFLALDLNGMSLGEEAAMHLGINVKRSKGIIFFLASFLTGSFVAVSGIIGFVGLVVPHFMRIVVGRDHRILLISSYLGGAVFLVFCDTLARVVISPLELPVGVITGLIGGVLFIYVLSKNYKTL
ncbi:MAG: iron ABC transporter permease [Candidatus Omnitrophica bacterium]|nr:iron ABC transporter permease [Candidatus Omnitrophota bacterium]